MKHVIAAAISLALLAAAAADAETMQITPNGSRPSAKGAAENFTASVVVTPLFGATAHTRGSFTAVAPCRGKARCLMIFGTRENALANS